MTRHTHFVITGLALIGLAISQPAANGNPTADAGCWSIVPSPNVGSGSSSLYRVSAVSANDVWASADYGAGNESTTQPASEHWDGNQWSIVPAPSVGTLGTRIQGISAASANDVWMVGAYDLTATNPNGVKTLTEHWDGTQWSVVPSPNPLLGARGSYLRGVEALSANDVWAVGYIVFPVAVIQTLIEHWDGTQWTIVSSPNGSGGGGLLHEVKGLTSNDVWAVGWAGKATLALHWDGSQWSVIPTPDLSSAGANLLEGVAPVSSNDVWAVGASDSGPITMHWDGSQWTLVPNPGVPGQSLYGVTAIAANDVWAIGFSGFSATNRTLAMHWDGVTWNIVSTAALGGNYLWGIDSVSANDVWAVGTGTLTERFTSPCGLSPLIPTSVVSRKIHGSAGTFDVDLPLTGPHGVECRSGGANGNYAVVFTFLNNITTCGTAGTAGAVVSSGPNPNQCTENLTAVPNAQYSTITLNGVVDSVGATGNASATMGVLLGDVNANGTVSNADAASIQAKVGATVIQSNFRNDVNANGTISNGDVAVTQAQVGTQLPP
jgi:hypothetical protein